MRPTKDFIVTIVDKSDGDEEVKFFRNIPTKMELQCAIDRFNFTLTESQHKDFVDMWFIEVDNIEINLDGIVWEN